MHPRKEGWSGQARDPSPISPGAASSLPLSPSSPPPTMREGWCRRGRQRQWGRESAAHFGLEGESQKQIHESKRWGQAGGSPQTACTYLLPPVPDRQASVPPPLRAGLVTKTKGDPGRLLGGNPSLILGAVQSRSDQKGRDSTVTF